jgi:sugar lactone lactonase YvrE
MKTGLMRGYVGWLYVVLLALLMTGCGGGSGGNANGGSSGAGAPPPPPTSATFDYPTGLGVDSAGNVYVADTLNSTIRKIATNGQVSTIAGQVMSFSFVNANGTSALFNRPFSVAVDSAGNIYVADKDNSVIRKITPIGDVSTLAGLPGSTGSADGVGSAARFDLPYGVAVDSLGNVYVADTGNSLIRKVAPDGTTTTVSGITATSYGLAADAANNVYVADSTTRVIYKITPTGTVSVLAGSNVTNAALPADGTGTGANFSNPVGIAADSSGYVYVVDTDSSQTIRKVSPAGVVTTLAGTFGMTGSTDGTGAAARFNSPYGIAVDASGNVFVSDTATNIIRKITPSGVVTTIAGIAGVAGHVDN